MQEEEKEEESLLLLLVPVRCCQLAELPTHNFKLFACCLLQAAKEHMGTYALLRNGKAICATYCYLKTILPPCTERKTENLIASCLCVLPKTTTLRHGRGRRVTLAKKNKTYSLKINKLEA